MCDKTGKEIGVYGPEGWFRKHGKDIPIGVSDELDNALRGISIDELRRAGQLKPKGRHDGKVKGKSLKELGKMCKGPCTAVGGAVLIIEGAQSGEPMPLTVIDIICDAFGGCAEAQ